MSCIHLRRSSSRPEVRLGEVRFGERGYHPLPVQQVQARGHDDHTADKFPSVRNLAKDHEAENRSQISCA